MHKLKKVVPTKDCFLVTLDVDSLYTNIDKRGGVSAVKKAFEENPDEARPDKQIIALLRQCLEFNDFKFNDEWFLQIGGTAMGKKFAPNYANLFLAQWEKEALAKCSKKPLCYFRYLDDIFLIWPHSKTDFDCFFQILNSHHPNITLKPTIHDRFINFLDVTVFKGPNWGSQQILDSKVFFKPTDTHELLHGTSYHPKHTFKGIIKSQIIRFHRICSRENDFEEACTILFQALKHRNYNPRFLRKIKTEYLQSLIPRGRATKCDHPRCKTCPLISEYTNIHSTKNNIWPLKENLNCKSESVVYAITCTNCGSVYVGKTCRNYMNELANTEKPFAMKNHAQFQNTLTKSVKIWTFSKSHPWNMSLSDTP